MKDFLVAGSGGSVNKAVNQKNKTLFSDCETVVMFLKYKNNPVGSWDNFVWKVYAPSCPSGASGSPVQPHLPPRSNRYTVRKDLGNTVPMLKHTYFHLNVLLL